MKTLAMIAFIAAVGGGAAYLAQKQTVIDGHVMAADLLAAMHRNGARQIAKITCDDRIPVDTAGAVFTCEVALDDGATSKIEFTMDRAANYTTRELGHTGATRERVPATGDPWGN